MGGPATCPIPILLNPLWGIEINYRSKLDFLHSVLVLTVTCKAAARVHDLRTEISDALAELPTLFANTRIAMGIFKGSKELEQCGVELYVTTLAALRHIVIWYTERVTSKLLLPVLNSQV
jgi:hypothetical protein